MNTGGYWATNGFLSLGRTLHSTKLNFNLTTNASLSRTVSLINGQTNRTNSRILGQTVRLQSTYDGKLDYGVSGTVSYQTVTYSLLPRQNTAFWAQYATADVHWQLPFNLVLTTDVTYTATTDRAAGYNQ